MNQTFTVKQLAIIDRTVDPAHLRQGARTEKLTVPAYKQALVADLRQSPPRGITQAMVKEIARRLKVK